MVADTFGSSSLDFGLTPRLPGLAPAGDLLLWPSKEVGKKDAPTKPPARGAGALRCSAVLKGEPGKARRLAFGIAVVSFVVWGERKRTPTSVPLDVGVRKAHPNLQSRHRVARATLYSSTGEHGVQPRVGRCEAGGVQVVTCHVRERSGSLLPMSWRLLPNHLFARGARVRFSASLLVTFLWQDREKLPARRGGFPATTLAMNPKHRAS